MKKLIASALFFCAFLAFSSCDEPVNEDPGEEVPGEQIPEPEPKPEPEITITTQGAKIEAEAEGGEYSFSYSITNPADDGIVTLEIPGTCDWITRPAIESETITISILENENTEEVRNETLTVKYTYGDKSIDAEISVFQKEATIKYDFTTECIDGISSFYGNRTLEYDPNLAVYVLCIGTDPVNNARAHSRFYIMDLCTYEVSEDKLPIPGTYTLVPYGDAEDFSFEDYNSYADFFGEDIYSFSDYENVLFSEGTVTVEREGDIYTIQATITDTKGRLHYVTYNGELTLQDMTGAGSGLSSLTSDLDMDITGTHSVEAVFYDDFYGVGMDNYTFRFFTEGMQTGDSYITFEALVPKDLDITSDASTMMFESYYESEDGEYLYIPGGSNFTYSWFLTIDSFDPATGGITVAVPYAPISFGIVTITNNGDGTVNLSTEAYDDLGNRLTLHGDNLPITFTDPTAPAHTALSYKAKGGIMYENFRLKSLR